MKNHFNEFRSKVRKTKLGIIINRPTSGTVKAMYYRNGNYPDIPENPQELINDYGVTGEEKWIWDLGNYIPDRVYNFID